ncbi:bi-domain-containing oxidoreductase [Stieleria sp. JC731]|uniref:bi-domain-containing oxidoreductase n=1 Tax=Pirellulaceae TaxID=2691357 RepID=UPI001E3E0430|nr:bi-domain-containing oxidoreductase [Stieleria sp. JC731]MCC9601117.1 bi-domain-containing oxidoreductase [Stieleria sp. JC731]
MKQILQNLGSGETLLAEVPCPRRSGGSVLIQTRQTLVSLGTEKMLVDFGRGGYLAKARSQPDKVKQVLQKVKTDGLWTTIDAVKAKLDTPIPLGYCNVGAVVEQDAHSGFAIGDRVVSNGPHAEMVSIGENLVAKIPDGVSDETAAYTVVAAIGLQGLRLAQPTLGERFVVCGLGLIGLLTVQMLRANGCEVLGTDFDPEKLKLAEKFGAKTCNLASGEDPVRTAENWTDGIGVDGVIITASTKSDEVVHQAATMCRKRGRIVLVGVVGLNLRRADFYEKELSFQVSCSYGPGRYDANYEKLGLDYPIGHVRWTEKRNFEAVLAMMSDGRIQTDALTTHCFDFDNALRGYEAIHEKGALGILLKYKEQSPPKQSSVTLNNESTLVTSQKSSSNAGVAFIGAGGFTTRMLLPLLPQDNVDRRWIISNTGVSASYAAKKFGFQNCGSDVKTALDDPQVNTVFITTSHASHADLVCQSLDAGKHVFVEKPLALDSAGLERIREAMRRAPGQKLMVGFNRRFSPHTLELNSMLKGNPGPKSIVLTVNAGAIPESHWTQDPIVGGGRIIGEACHFIDLARAIANAPIRDCTATPLGGGDGRLGDCASIQLSFADGSIATVHYLSNGNKSFPKERVEVFSAGQVVVIDNFRKTFGFGTRKKLKTKRQDKGHQAELVAFLKSVATPDYWPIEAETLFEVTDASFTAARQIREQLQKFSGRS